jgi:hypothetical protein
MSEVEKEYSAGQRGERVGWVRVTPQMIDDREVIGIDLVAATVTGKDGAKFGSKLSRPQSESEIAISVPYEQGFSAVTAFSGMFGMPHNGHSFESSLVYSSTTSSYYGHEDTPADLLHQGTDDLHFKYFSDKTWANNGLALIDTLHQLLIDAKSEELYSPLYYWINGAIGRNNSGLLESLDGVQMSDLLLPDASLHFQTEQQLAHTEVISTLLAQALGNDKEMLSDITLLSETPANELSSVFEKSREKARQLYLDVINHIGQLAVRRLVHVPAERGRGSHSWPHMNVTEQTADRLYGVELGAIKEQSIGRAQVKLEREMKELEHRQEFAADAAHRFGYLAAQELIISVR